MTETVYPAPVADKTGYSFKRVIAFARYYAPQLRTQFLIYIIASFCLALLLLIPVREVVQVLLIGSVWGIMGLLFYCGPLVFARKDDYRIIERLIPVSAAEKTTVYFVYILIVVPLSVYLLPWLAEIIYINVPSLHTPAMMELMEFRHSVNATNLTINILNNVATVLTCFYCVMYAHRSRLIKGIRAIIAVNAVSGLFGAFIGGAAAFKMGFQDGMTNVDRMGGEQLADNILNDMLTLHNPLTVAYIVIFAIYSIVIAYMSYKTIRSRNL